MSCYTWNQDFYDRAWQICLCAYALGRSWLYQKSQRQAWCQCEVFAFLLSGACLKSVCSNSLKWRESQHLGGHLRYSVYSVLRRRRAEQGKHHKEPPSLSTRDFSTFCSVGEGWERHLCPHEMSRCPSASEAGLVQVGIPSKAMEQEFKPTSGIYVAIPLPWALGYAEIKISTLADFFPSILYKVFKHPFRTECNTLAYLSWMC